MAEIEEVVQEFGNNAKRLVKSKPFKIAAVCVGGVAILVALSRNKEEDEAQGYGAIGYAGYPSTTDGSMTGSEGSDSSYFEQILADMQAAQDQNFSDLYGHLSDMQAQLDQNDLNSNSNVSGFRQVSQTDETDALMAYIEKQDAIAQMRANSELYNTITDRAAKDALHAENMAIAERYGFTFNAETGNYYEGNSVVYTTAKQEAGLDTSFGTKKAPSGSVSYQNNVDYQSRINKAIMEGASATTINDLNKQRDAKISAQGGMTASQAQGYDKNVDYSTLISKAQASGADASVIKNLEQQRQNKINAEYGGKDPAKTTTVNKAKTTTVKGSIKK